MRKYGIWSICIIIMAYIKHVIFKQKFLQILLSLEKLRFILVGTGIIPRNLHNNLQRSKVVSLAVCTLRKL